MALKTAYQFRGISISEAYIRLESISGGKQRRSWSGEFSIYQSAVAANPPQPKPPVPEIEVQVLPDGLPVKPKPAPPVPERVLPQSPLAGFSITVPWVEGGVPEKLLYTAAKEQAMLADAVDA